MAWCVSGETRTRLSKLIKYTSHHIHYSLLFTRRLLYVYSRTPRIARSAPRGSERDKSTCPQVRTSLSTDWLLTGHALQVLQVACWPALMLLTVVDDMVVDLGRFSYISRPHCIIDMAATPTEPDVQQLFSSFQLPLEKG
jgi:hypothetical protein